MGSRLPECAGRGVSTHSGGPSRRETKTPPVGGVFLLAEPSAIGLQTPVYPFGGELCDGMHSGEIQRGFAMGDSRNGRAGVTERPTGRARQPSLPASASRLAATGSASRSTYARDLVDFEIQRAPGCNLPSVVTCCV